jgi:hypothetical protein
MMSTLLCIILAAVYGAAAARHHRRVAEANHRTLADLKRRGVLG